MPLSEEEKTYIVNQVAEILGAPDREQRITALRRRVLDDAREEGNLLDDTVYSVVQAILELYE